MAFEYTVPATAFSDLDGDALTYSATLSGGSALPDWLTFTPGTRTFASARLPDAAVGTHTLKVTASDGTDEISDEFDLVVSASCVAPDLGGRRQVWSGTVTVGSIRSDGATSHTDSTIQVSDPLRRT